MENGHEEIELTDEQLKRHRYEQLKKALSALDHDIAACEDGQIKAKTLEEYRAERREKRNELRQLLNKEPLNEEEII